LLAHLRLLFSLAISIIRFGFYSMTKKKKDSRDKEDKNKIMFGNGL
jgi:hypothetical protein